MFLGGLDVGTTGCKLSVYDEKGSFVYNSYKEYEVSRASGEHEIDATKIFEAVCEVLKDVAQKYELDSMVKDEPTGIMILPHFAGAANPYMDNGSKAAMIGLTLEHTNADMYKALMEGVTYEIMTNIEHLESFGINPQKLYATGGGAYSDVWLQIKADILNRPVTALLAKEAGTCGTCMMTGVAVGVYKDLYDAKEAFVKEKQTFVPNKDKTAVYKKYYNAYKNIYNAVRPIIAEIEK